MILSQIGWKLSRNLPDFVVHEYESYEEYKSVQVYWNKKKIDRIWADSKVLDLVADKVMKENFDKHVFGLCHGSRNGFEQKYLSDLCGGKILGTDISETANQFPNSLVHDFHDVKTEWIERADFIYSNSLDQSWNPKLALRVWVDQLRFGGLLFIEMSEAHSPRHASKMDPFGVKPEYFSFLITQWLGHSVSVEVTLTEKSKWNLPIWLYELRKIKN